VLARWAAWYVVLGGALLVGFGAAGIVIGSLAGAADAARYLALVGVAQLLLGASLAVGLYVGVRSRSRARAVGIAVVLWAVLTIGVDLVAIAALAILPAQPSGWALSLVLVGDPVDSARVLGLGLFRADVIAGPTGAALRQVLGGFGPWVLLAGLATWTIAPLIQAGRRFARSDL